jgi:hypothetical protein
MYPIDLMTRQFGISPLGGYNGQSAMVDGAWADPALLQELQTTGYGDQMILRGPYALAGNVYDSVSFLYRAEGTWQDSTFDATSGALLATNSRVEGEPSPVHGPLDDPQGNVQLSYTRLVNVRTVSVPGLGAERPMWASEGTTLNYAGSTMVVNPMDPSAQFSYPVQVTVTFEEVGATWAMFRAHSVVDYGQYRDEGESTGATGPTGAYWYDPDSLATMSTGVLDNDPVTGAQISVEAAGNGTVTIITQMNGATLSLTYETASGVLVAMQSSNFTTGITLQLQLVQG